MKNKVRFFTNTSFLCALYREQDNTKRADAFMETFKGEIIVSLQVLWEFRQSARFQVFRYLNDASQGFSKIEAERMLGVLAANVKAGNLTLETVEWSDVHSVARHLGLKQFLTFDGNQKKLAEAEGLVVSVRSGVPIHFFSRQPLVESLSTFGLFGGLKSRMSSDWQQRHSTNLL